MGANPMQKMKRNSTLTGLFIGLVIGLILCVLVYIVLTKTPVGQEKKDAVAVSVLSRNIKSGEKITLADISTKIMGKDDIPADAVTISKDVIAKIDLTVGTVITKGMLNQSSQEITSDLREQEYNMIILPTELNAGDFIDIRLQLASGGDYIVIAKKEVLKCDSATIWLKMTEEERLVLNNAIIEYYIMAGSKLYATTYTDPGLQEASTITYCPNSEVESLIKTYRKTDAGIFSEALVNIRNSVINSALRQYSDTAIDNVEQKIQEEIKSLKESREAYFGALNSAY